MNARIIATVVAAFVMGTSAANAATPPGMLVVAQSIDDIISLDPADGFELSSIAVFNNVYQRLVDSDPVSPEKLVPVLAESWEAGADGRSLVFALRKGAKFASGNPVRSEDVIYSLSRSVKLNKAPAFILNELGWKPENVDGFLAKVDDTHVKVSWPANVGPSFALSILTSPNASVLDEKLVKANVKGDDFGNEWLKLHSAGTGPFKLKTYQPHEAVVLEANPTSPTGAPKLKGVILKNVADAASRRLMVTKGDADIARDLGPDQIAALEGQKGVKVEVFPSSRILYIAFNAASQTSSVAKNPALWEAARSLVDYDSIAQKLLKGQYATHQAFLPSGFPGALKDKPYTFDPAKAKAVLEKAGLKDVSIKLDVLNQPPYTDIAQALQASFAEGGVKLEIQPSVGTQLFAKYRAREQEALMMYWGPDYVDPHTNASTFSFNPNDGTKTLAWRNGWDIPELSAKTQAAVQEQDQTKRLQSYIDLQKAVQKESPFVVFLEERQGLLMRETVKGFVQSPATNLPFYDQVTK